MPDPAAIAFEASGHLLEVLHVPQGVLLRSDTDEAVVDLSPRFAFAAWVSLDATHVVLEVGAGQTSEEIVVITRDGNPVASYPALDACVALDPGSMQLAVNRFGQPWVDIHVPCGGASRRVALPDDLVVEFVAICGDMLFVAEFEGAVACVSARTGRELWRTQEHDRGDIDAFAIAPGANEIVAARVGSSVARAWSLAAEEPAPVSYVHGSAVRWLACAETGAVVATAGGGTVRIHRSGAFVDLDGGGPLCVDRSGDRVGYVSTTGEASVVAAPSPG